MLPSSHCEQFVMPPHWYFVVTMSHCGICLEAAAATALATDDSDNSSKAKALFDITPVEKNQVPRLEAAGVKTLAEKGQVDFSSSFVISGSNHMLEKAQNEHASKKEPPY